MIWLQYIWKYKAWVLLALVVVSTLAYIAFLRIDLSLKKSKVEELSSKIVIVERQNQILSQNAIAIKKQDETLKKIQASVAPLKGMVAQIKPETKRVLDNEEITRLNDCIVDFANGVLSKGCDAIETYLPKSK
jgi:hypothetical protein